MKPLWLLLVGVALGWAASGVDWSRGAVGQEVKSEDAADDIVTGEMLVLAESDFVSDKRPLPSPPDINVGGVVAIRIDDTDGKPTKFDRISVKPEGAVKRIGQVRSNQDESGAIMMSGSGFTWLLYTPVRPGKAYISMLTYPNDIDKPVVRGNTVNVVEAN